MKSSTINNNDWSEKTIKSAVDSLGRLYATGRRKESVARVWIKPGSGKFSVNKKGDLISYFKESQCAK